MLAKDINEFNNTGYMVRIIENSMLDYLQPNTLGIEQQEDQDYAQYIQNLNTASSVMGPHTQGTIYQARVDDFATELSRILITHVDFTKNTVIPLVSELGNKLSSNITDSRSVDPETLFKIIDFSPAYSLIETWNESINRLSELRPTAPLGIGKLAANIDSGLIIDKVRERYGAPTVAWLIESLGTLAGIVIEGECHGLEIRSLEDYLRLIFISYFTDQRSIKEVYRDYVNLPDHGLYIEAVTVALIAEILIDNPELITDLSSQTLKEYNGRMQSIHDWAIVELTSLHKRIVGHINMGRIISSANINRYISTNHKFMIVVNREVHDQFDEFGLVNETILGHVVRSEGNNLTLQNLIDDKDRYLRQYQEYLELYYGDKQSRLLTDVKDWLKNRFFDSLNQLTDIENGYIEKLPEKDRDLERYCKQIIQGANQYIDQLSMFDLDHPEMVALRLVAQYRFHFTDAYAILSDMEMISGQMETRDGQSIAIDDLLAMVLPRRIIESLMSQVVVTTLN